MYHNLSSEREKHIPHISPTLKNCVSLGYSFDRNLAPKLDYLQRELGLSDESLRERVVGSPVILETSLKGRLKPRVELCKKLGLPAERMLFSYLESKPDDFKVLCQRAAGLKA